MSANAPCIAQAAIDVNLAAIFVSLELSRSSWVVTSLSPGKGEKMSKHSVDSGDVAGLLNHFAKLRTKAQARIGKSFPIMLSGKPAWMASGSTACWSRKASRATWSTPPRC